MVGPKPVRTQRWHWQNFASFIAAEYLFRRIPLLKRIL
jgi:hypothetical protein